MFTRSLTFIVKINDSNVFLLSEWMLLAVVCYLEFSDLHYLSAFKLWTSCLFVLCSIHILNLLICSKAYVHLHSALYEFSQKVKGEFEDQNLPFIFLSDLLMFTHPEWLETALIIWDYIQNAFKCEVHVQSLTEAPLKIQFNILVIV